ncbi:MAG: leucine-rich repeat domain-containing protein [Flavicella sp.]
MKKLYPLILFLMPLTNFAQVGTTFTDSNNVKYEITSESPNEVKVIENTTNRPTGDINLTNLDHNGKSYSITSIGERAFRYCTSLISITIPESITSIGDDAFGLCSSLTSVSISDSVTSLGDYVFRRCTNLTSITIPESVTSIGKYAFEGCTSLIRVVSLAQTPATLGTWAFIGINANAELIVPIDFKSNYFSKGWSSYFTSDKIIENSTLSSASNYFDDLILFTDNGEIKANLNNISFEVYTVEGKKVANSNLKRGIYIVVAKNEEGRTHRQKVLY